MDQQPKIPTLKDAQKPQVKIKGLSAGMTLFDRLKQFKKKDLAFILAGLGTLFMAPLAEHFMMAPEGGDGQLEKGWGGGKGGSGSNIFGNGTVSPYETGGGIAQGGAVGGMGDIITPLNVRDPSALVMGPGAAQQPNAGSIAPASPPPSASAKPETDYKDALAGAASRAASAAVKKSPLPVPKVALGGSGLRGLGVAGGGTSASGSLGPIGPAAGGTGAGGGGSLNLARSAPGYKGIAGARGPGNPTGLDSTKKAGANAGDAFSRTGSALSGLNAAASEQIPTGGSGFGGGGQGGAGANDKGPGGSGPGGSKSVGESLAFLEAKQRMENKLKNEFEMEKLKDNERLMYEIRNDAAKEIAKGLAGAFTKSITGALFPAGGGGTMRCGGMEVTTASAEGQLCSAGKEGAGETREKCYTKGGDGSYTYVFSLNPPVSYPCTGSKGTGTPEPNAESSVYKFARVSDKQSSAIAGLGQVCVLLDKIIETNSAATGGGSANADKLSDATRAANVRKEAAGLVSLRDAIYKANSSDCTGDGRRQPLDGITRSLALQQRSAIDNKVTPLINSLKKSAAGVADVTADEYTKAEEEVAAARKTLEDIRANVKDDLSNIGKADQGWTAATTGISGNAEKIEKIRSTMADSRDGLITALSSSVDGQLLLDGKKDGKAVEDPGGKDKAMPQLEQIVKGPSPDAAASGAAIKVTVETNKANAKFLSDNDAKMKNYGSTPTGGTADAATSDPKGVGFGVGGKTDAYTKKQTDAQPLVVKADEDATAAKGLRTTANATVDNAATTDVDEKAVAEKAATDAEKVALDSKGKADIAVDSVNKTKANVQTSQTGWLDTVTNRVESAKSSLPPAR